MEEQWGLSQVEQLSQDHAQTVVQSQVSETIQNFLISNEIISGASTATCSNGMWNPTFLGTCSLIGGSTTGQCSALTIPSGAQATYSPFSLSTTSFTSGTVATVTCTTGGSMLGTSTCTNGLWSPAIMGTCSGTGEICYNK